MQPGIQELHNRSELPEATRCVKGSSHIRWALLRSASKNTQEAFYQRSAATRGAAYVWMPPYEIHLVYYLSRSNM